MAAPPLLGVHHLAVLVRELQRAEAFYVGVLGLPVLVRHQDDAGAHRSTWVDLGGGRFLAIELFHGEDLSMPRERLGHHCVALGIAKEDRPRWAAHLGACGVEIVRETAFTLYVRDPDGSLVGLSHHPT